MEPQIINLPTPFKRISHIGCGMSHSVVVGDVDNTESNPELIYLFGNNQFGQCGRQIIENEIYKDSTVMLGVTLPKRVKQVRRISQGILHKMPTRLNAGNLPPSCY